MTELYAEFLALDGTNEKPWATRPARRADVSYGSTAVILHLYGSEPRVCAMALADRSCSTLTEARCGPIYARLRDSRQICFCLDAATQQERPRGLPRRNVAVGLQRATAKGRSPSSELGTQRIICT
jgi:hypothetical protein